MVLERLYACFVYAFSNLVAQANRNPSSTTALVRYNTPQIRLPDLGHKDIKRLLYRPSPMQTNLSNPLSPQVESHLPRSSILFLPIRLPHPRKHMALHSQRLLTIPVPRPIQRTQPTVQVAVEEKHHTVPITRIAVDDPVHTANVLVARPLGQHVPHIHDIGVRIGSDGHEGVSVGVEDLEARVFVLEEQRDGAEIGMCARTQLSLLRLLGGRVVEKSQGRGGGAGGEGFEDVGAVGQSTGDEIEDRQAEIVDRVVVSFGWMLEARGSEEGGRGPDVGTHEEAAGEDGRGGWREGGADVETLGVGEGSV